MNKLAIQLVLMTASAGVGYALRQIELKKQLQSLDAPITEVVDEAVNRGFKLGFEEAIRHPECQNYADYKSLYMTTTK